MKKLLTLLIITTILACSDSESDLPFVSEQYRSCNERLLVCPESVGDYCLFGFKWGENNDFDATGVEAIGPQLSGGVVSYSFQEGDITVSNHRQENVPTLTFSDLPCEQELIRKALEEWSSVADLKFVEMPDNSESDIQVFVAEVSTGGNGFPNMTSSVCRELSGHMILSPSYTQDCDRFYLYVLHELGHVMGLGHSSGDNIMGAISTRHQGLQPGDIKGMQQIYGE